MEAQCELAEQLYYSVNLHVLQWVHLLFSLASIILCMYTARKYVHKSLFESSTKELIIALYIFCIVHSGVVAALQMLHLASRYTASTPCHAQILKKLCILRMIATPSISGFCIIQTGITAQRFASTFNYSYLVQKIMARVCIVVSTFYCAIFGFISYNREPMDGFSPYCSAFATTSQTVLVSNLYGMAGLDIVNIFATLALWRYNKNMMKSERTEYNLEKTFHRKQNIIAIKQFLPVNFFHIFTYVIFAVMYSMAASIRPTLTPAQYTFLNGAVNVMPYYCLMAPLTLLVLIRKGKFERTKAVRGLIAPERKEFHKDMYFHQLNSMWNQPTPVTNK